MPSLPLALGLGGPVPGHHRHAATRERDWFTEGYAAQMPEIGPQLAHLDCLVNARWLANAIYFCSRIERGIERRSDSPTANRDGLAAAYAGMTAAVVALVLVIACGMAETELVVGGRNDRDPVRVHVAVGRNGGGDLSQAVQLTEERRDRPR